MSLELVRTITSDGVNLDGAFYQPDVVVARPLALDALLVVHGTGSQFYAGGVLARFAEQALGVGMNVLRVNTRGHDVVCSLNGPGGSRRGGAAFECVDDCRFDVQAWIGWLAGRGCQSIGVVGHSMGAVKSIYALSHECPPEVAGLVAISPPRFCHQNFITHRDGKEFAAEYALAEAAVAAGRGQELREFKHPLRLLITMAGYLDKYGPHDRYDYAQHLPRIACPALAIVGERSIQSSMAFDGAHLILETIARRAPNIRWQLVAGADTNYAGLQDEPFRRAFEWIAGWGRRE